MYFTINLLKFIIYLTNYKLVYGYRRYLHPYILINEREFLSAQ